MYYSCQKIPTRRLQQRQWQRCPHEYVLYNLQSWLMWHMQLTTMHTRRAYNITYCYMSQLFVTEANIQCRFFGNNCTRDTENAVLLIGRMLAIDCIAVCYGNAHFKSVYQLLRITLTESIWSCLRMPYLPPAGPSALTWPTNIPTRHPPFNLRPGPFAASLLPGGGGKTLICRTPSDTGCKPLGVEKQNRNSRHRYSKEHWKQCYMTERHHSSEVLYMCQNAWAVQT